MSGHAELGVVQWLRERLPLSTDLTCDSRKLNRGEVFVAYPGARHDARNYIDQALQLGAAAVLYDASARELAVDGVPSLAVPQLKQLAGPIAAAWYGAPSERLFSIGVTGTSGKSTSALWLAQALASLGHRPVLVGTLGAGFLSKLVETGHTTPDPVDLQRLLARLLAQGADVLAIEVTSIALVEGRANGMHFDVALFTNLSRDHLDYHPSMDAYREAKARLFSWPGLAAGVMNLDDPATAVMQAALGAQAAALTYSAQGDPRADLYARSIDVHAAGMTLHLVGQFGERLLKSAMVGRFNADNLLGVLSVLLAAGVDVDTALSALGTLTPAPGRLEPVQIKDTDASEPLPLVLIDYAHKPDALEKALLACQGMARQRQGRLLLVFGCGGDRDRGKRGLMGEIASRLADRVVVTSDNPRSEAPESIVHEIMAGVPADAQTRSRLESIVDRRLAIATAVQSAAPQDVVLIAGKGHESYQDIGGHKLPFSDLDEAKQALWARLAVRAC